MNDRNLPPSELEADITELYALYQPGYLAGTVGQLGRQRFREPREWIFDEYQDALRLYYIRSAPLVIEAAYIHAINPIKEKFTTWTDYFVRVRWYTDARSRFAAYVLARRDSDESRQRQPVWWGVRYVGQVTGAISSWADLVLQRGEDKLRPVRSYAVDLGATVTAADIGWKPAFTLGYAKGSGDETNSDEFDNTYRQTGYEDNVSRMSGRGRTKYYGNLLDPELSNLKVYTASVGIQPYRDGSLELVYHTYHQEYADDNLRGSGLVDPPARPNGVSTDIGWAMDIVIRIPRLWDALGMKWTLAMFNPGEAFAPRQANAYFGQVNVTFGV
jgi:alginate production protein